MIQTTVKISGMACSMCEAHINDTIRRTFSVEKVSSSHTKGKTVILSRELLDEAALRAAIAQDDLVQAQQRMADLLAQTEDFDALVTQLSHPAES